MTRVLHRRTLVHLLAVALYLVLALVATWPLVRTLGTHVPGSDTWAFDEYTFIWNSWWLRHSLFDLGQNPLYSTHTFYPLGISLAFYTYNLFNALISLPLQPFLSLPAISNLTFLLATVLSGYGVFILVETLLGSAQRKATDEQQAARDVRLGSLVIYSAAFLAGLIYAFGSYRFVYAAIGHYDKWSTAWIPFYALYLFKTIRERRMRNAVLAAVFLVFSQLTELVFGVFLGMLTIIVLAFVAGRRGREEVAGGWPSLLGRLAVMGLVATLLYLPVLAPVVEEMFGGYELAGWGDAEKLSADLVGLVTPTALHPLGGDWVETLRQAQEGTSRFRDVNTVFLGWMGLALAIVGAVCYRRKVAAWITSFVVFTVFSLGPVLQINGRSMFDLDGLLVNVPLPFIVLHYIPLVKANRVPNRFSVVLMLSLAVLAGFGAYWLLAKLRRSKTRLTGIVSTACTLFLAAFIMFEHWSVPLPLTDARIPAVYRQVAEEPGDFAILQLPMGWRNSFGVQGAENTRTQYYQTYHHKRLLSGNISRNPPFKFDYFWQIPILESLISIQTYGEVDAERRAIDRATAGEFVSFYDIRYVVVAPGVPGRPPYVDTREAALAYVEEVLPVEKVADQDGWLLYRVDQSPLPADFEVDLGSPEPRTAMALGEGWGGLEEIQGATASWSVAQDARIFLPSTGGAAYRLTMTALPFEYPGASEQGVSLQVNGQQLERVAMSSGWGTCNWDIPADVVRSGLNEVRFSFDRLDAPADVLPGNGEIGATGLQAPVDIEVNSGGPADFAFIAVGSGDEAQDGSAHSPGYNVAVIHPRSGKILDQRGFNTSSGGSEAEAAALADMIDAVPDGRIVVVAMQGDGAAYLTEEAVAAFYQVGGQVDPRDTAGWSHAIIGVKGAARGAALEVAGPDNGWLRAAPDRRTLAVAVDLVLWERME
jgi:hypothetical protein